MNDRGRAGEVFHQVPLVRSELAGDDGAIVGVAVAIGVGSGGGQEGRSGLRVHDGAYGPSGNEFVRDRIEAAEQGAAVAERKLINHAAGKAIADVVGRVTEVPLD